MSREDLEVADDVVAGELEATPPPLLVPDFLPDLAAGDIAGEALDLLMA